MKGDAPRNRRGSDGRVLARHRVRADLPTVPRLVGFDVRDGSIFGGHLYFGQGILGRWFAGVHHPDGALPGHRAADPAGVPAIRETMAAAAGVWLHRAHGQSAPGHGDEPDDRAADRLPRPKPFRTEALADGDRGRFMRFDRGAAICVVLPGSAHHDDAGGRSAGHRGHIPGV